jgi:hypothetical protein
VIGNLKISDGRNIQASNVFTRAHTRLFMVLLPLCHLELNS